MIALARIALLAATAVFAAVLVVSPRQGSPAALLRSEPPNLQMDAVCQQAQAARGIMQQQRTMCSSLCDGTARGDDVVGIELAECAQCGSTVNINLPGSLPYYPYYPSCVQSSYDPWEWYDYYYKYDPALAPYYEPWTPPDVDIVVEEAPEEEEATEETPEVSGTMQALVLAQIRRVYMAT